MIPPSVYLAATLGFTGIVTVSLLQLAMESRDAGDPLLMYLSLFVIAVWMLFAVSVGVTHL